MAPARRPTGHRRAPNRRAYLPSRQGRAPRPADRTRSGCRARRRPPCEDISMSTITLHYRSVQQLLQSQSFSIDEYQREYKWEKENVDELITDLQEKFLSCYQPGHEPAKVASYEDYFLGSIIVSKRN